MIGAASLEASMVTGLFIHSAVFGYRRMARTPQQFDSVLSKFRDYAQSTAKRATMHLYKRFQALPPSHRHHRLRRMAASASAINCRYEFISRAKG